MSRANLLALLALLAPLAARLAAAEASDSPLQEAALASDDECAANGDGSEDCTLNAIQLRAKKQAPIENNAIKENSSEATDAPLGVGVNGTEVSMGCGKSCMMGNVAGGEPLLGASPIQHWSLNCWYACGGKAGSCDSFCGYGNACCRYYAATDPPECRGVRMWPSMSWHTCVHGTGGGGGGAGAPTPSYTPSDKSSHPYFQVGALAMPSSAPLLTFYMYRVQSDNNYPPENVNTASLAGIMWYLHNEVVWTTPRKFGITRIMRIKVSTRAPQPLYSKGMNFGVRYAFDSGQCTGPWSCAEKFREYGYFVGCNNVGDFPTAKWKADNYYQDAIWYSLPGPCSEKTFSSHDPACMANSPGGACAGPPTGRGDCTYNYEEAGEVRIDDLEGISNYASFTAMGGKEYDQKTDMGYGTSFWNHKKDAAACAARVAAASRLFSQKYGLDLPTPKCDFNYGAFYDSGTVHANLAATPSPAPKGI